MLILSMLTLVANKDHILIVSINRVNSIFLYDLYLSLNRRHKNNEIKDVKKKFFCCPSLCTIEQAQHNRYNNLYNEACMCKIL